MRSASALDQARNCPEVVEVAADARDLPANRTAFLPERRVMMQEWADYLDRLRAGQKPGRTRLL